MLASLASYRLGLNWQFESIELFTLCWWVSPAVWNVGSQRLVSALELPVILCLCALSTVHTWLKMLPSGICPPCIYFFCLPRVLSLGLSLFLMNCTISEFIQCRWWQQFDQIINNLDQVQLEWANGHLTLSHTWFYWQDHYASLIMCLKASSSPWMSKWSTISSFVATASVYRNFQFKHFQCLIIYTEYLCVQSWVAKQLCWYSFT